MVVGVVVVVVVVVVVAAAVVVSMRRSNPANCCNESYKILNILKLYQLLLQWILNNLGTKCKHDGRLLGTFLPSVRARNCQRVPF